ncbi:MAG: amino-acid N-acetyltransferase [Gammaproteobacteria bacterium]|nr:amino-acid N-acetyltransferase [Gammaproteobacteria bacterium]
MAKKRAPSTDPFVEWFRNSSPYIHAHRGCTFVLAFDGEALRDGGFASLANDIALLNGLGIRLVLVHGARPQIEASLRLRNAQMQIVNGLRVTDDAALACVKEAAGTVRVEVEALLSVGLTNSPMAGANIRVASGNFVTAQPLGVLGGVDYCHTGKVRRIDAKAISQLLETGAIALIPPLGYSPTGEVFNLAATDVAASVAIALGAEKLILLLEEPGLRDTRGRIPTNVIPTELEAILKRRRNLSDELRQSLNSAIDCCRRGVKRVHLLDRNTDGALLRELFTRDGIGTMLTAAHYEGVRDATIDDVGGILELLSPLERQGVLVRRSRELLETEIDRFSVVELDGAVIGCAALYCYAEERMAEMACVAVHPDYRAGGRGDNLLGHMESRARALGIEHLFVLTTQTTHWFIERGFEPLPIKALPIAKRQLYNFQRNSKVLVKRLT